MFFEADAFNQDIGSWDVRDPRRLERAFRGGPFDDRRASRSVGRARAPPPSSSWERRSLGRARGQHVRATQVSGVTNMRYMFYCDGSPCSFNQELGWCVSPSVEDLNAFVGSGCTVPDCGVTVGDPCP